MPLIRTVAREYRAGSLKQDLHVQHRGPHSRVLQIKSYHLVKSSLAPAAHLPQACNTGPGFEQAPAVPNIVGLDFVWDRRPRSYQGHFAIQHVPELWDFIQARASHEFSDPGHAWIVRNFINALFASFSRLGVRFAGDEIPDIFPMDRSVGGNIHGPELHKHKSRTELANSLLTEENRASRSQFDHRREH